MNERGFVIFDQANFTGIGVTAARQRGQSVTVAT